MSSYCPSKCCIKNSSFNFRLGEVCSHVAAILFKIEASVRLGYNKVACTSMPCLWNQNFTKKVNLNWYSFIFVLNFCRIMIILLIISFFLNLDCEVPQMCIHAYVKIVY